MLNICIVEGFLVADPIVNHYDKGKSVATFIIASHHDGYGKGVEYIKCTAAGPVAEAMEKFKSTGDRVIVVGALANRKWENYKKEDVYETVLKAWKVNFQERLTSEEKKILKEAKKEKENDDEFDN